MGLFDFLKKKKQEPETPRQTAETNVALKTQDNSNKSSLPETALAPIDAERKQISIHPSFAIHEDIKDLIWIGDGKYKNYTPENKYGFTAEFNGIKITFSCNYGNEPSIIYTKQPIAVPQDETLVPRPPYYPSYSELTPEQKWIYLKLLANPYDADINIGYVFILYYGLERHLLSDDFEKAFRVILKLRDAHVNSSFQRYSANALILSAMLRKKGEFVLEFLNSLDKEHEFNFWDNLLLMCYYSFDMPVLPKDIMRMYGTFGWTNVNYIKKYPGIFEDNIKNVLAEKTGKDKIFLKDYLTINELKKIPAHEDRIFANVSIIDQKMPVPLLTDNATLRKTIYTVLEQAHNMTKTQIAKMRKGGALPNPAYKPKHKVSAASILAEEAARN